MSVKLGTLDISLKLGSADVSAAYIGETLIYSGGTFEENNIITYTKDNDGMLGFDETQIKDENGDQLNVVSHTFDSNALSGSIEFDGDIYEIGDRAFAHSDNLASIVLPSTIATIGYNAFQGRFELTSFTIYADLPPMYGGDVFDDTPIAQGIGIIYVPSESVSDYENDMDWGQFNIQPIGSGQDMPAEPELMGDVIHFTANTDIEQSIDFNAFKDDQGQTVGYIYNYNSSTHEGVIQFDGDVYEIGEDAFNSCYSLQKISLPSTLEIIGDFAFANCSLNGITLPDSFVGFGDFVFDGCSDFSIIKSYPTTPPSIGVDVFNDTPFSNGYGTVYVPSEAVIDYENDPEWGQYIIEAIS